MYHTAVSLATNPRHYTCGLVRRVLVGASALDHVRVGGRQGGPGDPLLTAGRRCFRRHGAAATRVTSYHAGGEGDCQLA